MATRRVRSTTRVEVASDRGVFMISVAAELADMHPQTLRMYEARGLIEPKRSAKGTRLYSHKDVERLRRIQEMTAELGMNLAGVERVFELEQQLEGMERKVRALEKRAEELKSEVERLEKIRRELRAEIVPYAKGGAIVRNADVKRFKLTVQRSAAGAPRPDLRAAARPDPGAPRPDVGEPTADPGRQPPDQ
jgi:MerR family transcriptional regulator/heat shock protein HspR